MASTLHSVYQSLMRLLGPLPAFTLLYAMIYGAFGSASPFWPRFFEWRGLSAVQLGVLLGLGTLMRLISGPLVGRLADLSGALRVVLAACTALSASLALGLLVVHGFWALLLIHLAQASALAPIPVLADALALNAAKDAPPRGGFEYGWVRSSGSAAFVIATLLAGKILSVSELSSIVWMHTALLLAAVPGIALVHRLQAPPSEQHSRMMSAWGGVSELWNIRLFRRLIIVAALVLGSHAMHDAFAVIRWSEAGIEPVVTSVLWSEAVAAEVVMFFLIGPGLVNRFGPSGAAALAATAGVVRWVVMAQTTSAVAIGMVQPLHGFTFALLHLACMRLVGVVVPERLAATAQALYALGAGLATASLMLLSGELYAAFGGFAFLLMALLCGLALPLAWFGLRTPRSGQWIS
jgi:MFS transporter, PPP family, 3-phenylpropionic acid transporter